MSSERINSKRYSRTAERVASTRASRIISTERLHTRDFRRTSPERLSPTMNPRRTTGSMVFITRHTISPELTETHRNSRISVQRLISAKDYRRTSTEQLPSQRSPRSSDFIASVLVTRSSADRHVSNGESRRSVERLASVMNSRISPEPSVPDRGYRRSAERLASVKGSFRITSERDSRSSAERLASLRKLRINAEPLASDRESRRSVKRLASVRDYIRIASERNFRGSAERLLSSRNSRLSAERLASDKESRRSLERSSSLRDTRRITADKDITRSAERLASVISAERKSERVSRSWIEHYTAIRNSRIYAERLISDRRSVERSESFRNSKNSAGRLASDRLAYVRDVKRSSTEPPAHKMDSRRSAERLATIMDSKRISTKDLASERDSRRSVGFSSSLKTARRLSSVRNSRKTSVEQLSSQRNYARIVYEKRSVTRQAIDDHLATRRVTTNASTRITSEHRLSQLERLSATHIISKTLEHHDTTKMSDVRNTRLSYGRLPRNQALYQGLILSEKQFSTMHNATPKTDSFLGNGLPLGTVQKSAEAFKATQYFSWAHSVTEYTRCALATLTLMWPAVAVWKGSILEHLTSFDVASAFSSKMNHLNSFFTDKVQFCNFL